MGSLGDESSQATTGASDQYREGREVLEEGSQNSHPRLGHHRAISKKSELSQSLWVQTHEELTYPVMLDLNESLSIGYEF